METSADFTFYRVTYRDGSTDVYAAQDFDELLDISVRSVEYMTSEEITADQYYEER